jgi:hypothetical protein
MTAVSVTLCAINTFEYISYDEKKQNSTTQNYWWLISEASCSACSVKQNMNFFKYFDIKVLLRRVDLNCPNLKPLGSALAVLL